MNPTRRWDNLILRDVSDLDIDDIEPEAKQKSFIAIEIYERLKKAIPWSSFSSVHYRHCKFRTGQLNPFFFLQDHRFRTPAQ